MYVYFKQDLKRNVTYVGNTETMDIGYVDGIHTISDTAPYDIVKELDDEMTKQLVKEGVCDAKEIK